MVWTSLLRRTTALLLGGDQLCLIGGLLGAVSLVLSLLDRFTPLRLQLCEVIPMCIQARSLDNDPNISVFGIGAVVRCRASSKTVFISGLALPAPDFTPRP